MCFIVVSRIEDHGRFDMSDLKDTDNNHAKLNEI